MGHYHLDCPDCRLDHLWRIPYCENQGAMTVTGRPPYKCRPKYKEGMKQLNRYLIIVSRERQFHAKVWERYHTRTIDLQSYLASPELAYSYHVAYQKMERYMKFVTTLYKTYAQKGKIWLK
jgi:hypothetical protein